ncbi:phosphoglucosamine mutase [bacterium]
MEKQGQRKLFGTDGIRGIAGKYPLDAETIKITAYEASLVLTKYIKSDTQKSVVVGRDTRSSGEWILDALKEGFMCGGINIIDAGIIPTPAVSFLVKKLNCICGVVISASHNTFEYNGIKFFSNTGEKLPDAVEHEIETSILQNPKVVCIDNTEYKDFREQADSYYFDFLKSTVEKDFNLDGIKIVIDCANGALYDIAPKFFKELGADVIALNTEPNGKNINAKCGSLHKDILINAVVKNNADLGFAFDGDGDRVLFTDEQGSDIDGDHLMCMTAVFLKEKGMLKDNNLVVTLMTNLGLKIAMKEINVFETAVGDRYVYEKMKEIDSSLGGEQSGHIIFRDFSLTGDGMLTSLQILRIIKTANKPLSSLAGIMEKLPQILVNVKVKERKDVMLIPSLFNAYKNIEKELEEKGRVVIRYSGTEPLLRIMIEGRDYNRIKQMADEYAELVKKEIG